MVAKPVTVGVVGVLVLASALVLNYFVLPGDERETATAVGTPSAPVGTAVKPGEAPKRTPAPAGTAVRPAAPGTAVTGTATGTATGTPPPKPAPSAEPSFDVVRVDPDGNTVLAGRGAPNSEIAIMDGGEEIGRVTTDSRGEWVFIPPAKLAPGQRVLFLRQSGAAQSASTGEVSDSVVLVIPEKGKDIAGRPASEPSMPLVVVVPKDDPGEGGKSVARVLQAPAAGPLGGSATAPTRSSAAAPAREPVAPGATAGGSATAGSVTAGSATASTSPTGAGAAGTATAGSAAAGSAAAGSAAAGTTAAGSAVAPTTEASRTASLPVATSGATSAPSNTPAPAEPAPAEPAPSSSASTGPASTASASGASAPTRQASTEPAPGAATSPPAETAAARPSAPLPVETAAAAPATPPVQSAAGPGVSAYPETAAGSAGQAGADKVAVDVIDYDDKGEVVFSGRSDPGARVEVYIDDKSVGGVGADSDGRWTMRPEAPVAPGSYQLRVDKVAAGGTVEARVAFPFVRANPLTELPNNRLVVIQPGNNLWRIATRVYGSGVRYVEIFDANKDQILDPDLIFPGQVFGLPRTN